MSIRSAPRVARTFGSMDRYMLSIIQIDTPTVFCDRDLYTLLR